MISISPTIRTNFQSQRNSVQTRQPNQTNLCLTENKRDLAMMGLSALVFSVIGIKSCLALPAEKALARSGIELKNGIAYIKKNGSKFTGSITRRSKAFGREKEIRSYVDGILTEELRYDSKKREVSGKFYRDGKLFREGFLSMNYGGEKIIAYREYYEKNRVFNGKIIKELDIKRIGTLPRKGAFDELRRKGDIPGSQPNNVLID